MTYWKLKRSHALSLQSSISTSGGLTITGGPTSDTDWLARSTATGVVRADRGSAAAVATPSATINQTNWLLNDSKSSNVSFDNSVKPHSSASGSIRMQSLNTDTANSGNVGFYFGNIRSFGPGDVAWYSYRIKAPANFWFQAHTVSSADETSRGTKLSIFSDRLSSSRPNETVFQLSGMAGIIRAYHQDGSNFPAEEIASSNACSTSDFRWQPKVDNGASPLIGTDPDTGSAWSSCAQTRAQYGGLYSAQNNASTNSYARGLGDPLTGGFRPIPDEWVTITGRVQFGTYGTATSRFSGWAAHDGQPYTLLFDSQNITLGAGAPDPNVLWLTNFSTNRNAGGRKVSSRTSNIGGITIHTCGTATPIGDGVLEYVASTGRFRWQSSGGAFGTARGFSVANDITFINVKGTTDQDHIVVEITNASALPSVGTTTDTVTIADGRPDTDAHYADFIVSTQPINAPGGFVPSGVNSLADQAASMASGTWAQANFSPTGLGNFVGGPTSGLKTLFAEKMAFDPVSDKIYWIGCDHAQDQTFQEFDLSTNAWTTLAATPFAAATKHGYDHTTWDSTHSKLYHRPYGTRTLYRWDGGSTWTAIDYSSTLFYGSAANGCEFMPTLGANGKVLIFQLENTPNGSLIGIDPVTQGITMYADKNLVNTGDPHNFAIYNPVSDVTFFGGGNSVTTCWTINSSGTITSKAAIPAAIGSIGPSTGGSAKIFAHPTNGNFIVIKSNTVWYEFNPTANTWTALGGTVDMLASNTFDASNRSDGIIGVALRKYGVLVFIKAYSSAANAQMWLYKP